MRSLIVVFLLFFVLGSALAQGTVVHDSFQSAAMGATKAVDVYLPHGYDGSTQHYPVIYFLHGLASNQSGYSQMIPVLDSLITAGAIEPLIVVKPDGSSAPYGGSMWANSALYGRFEDYVADDLVAYIDGHYRTQAQRSSRTIMGHSMGGYGCIRLAFKHTSNYCGVASLSGFLSVTPFDYFRSQVLSENNGHGPYNPVAGFFSFAAFTAAGGFSPNLSLPPYYVSLPIDDSGAIVDSVFTLWQKQMPGWLARQDTTVRSLKIYFDCGLQDELGFFPMNQNFASSLDSLNIPYRFESFNGTHESQLVQRGIVAFMFLDSLMRAENAADEPLAVHPEAFGLEQNYPNPFNSSTAIEFALPRDGRISLTVFDLLGRKVATLVDGGFLAAGTHRVTFDAAALSSGVYFYRLSGGSDFVQTRKMALLK